MIVEWIVKREVKKMLDNIKGVLGGYMTYITAVSGMLAAVIAWQQGALTTEKLVEALFAGVTAIFLRRGMKAPQP